MAVGTATRQGKGVAVGVGVDGTAVGVAPTATSVALREPGAVEVVVGLRVVEGVAVEVLVSAAAIVLPREEAPWAAVGDVLGVSELSAWQPTALRATSKAHKSLFKVALLRT